VSEDNTKTVASVLKAHGAKLFHAINFIDFKAYCARRAILSRAILEELCPDFTRFFTDGKDKDIGVWNRSFGNLQNFSGRFWTFEDAVPNAYGPITIVLNSGCWDALADLTVMKRTITKDDNRVIEAEALDGAFERSAKGQSNLAKGYRGIEVSASDSAITWDQLAYILVDPINLEGKSLRDHVVEAMNATGCLGDRITENQVLEQKVQQQGQHGRMTQLISWSRNLAGRLLEHNEPLERSLPAELENWFGGLNATKKSIMASWLTYTYNGTLRRFGA
jgi:hypothetical protein